MATTQESLDVESFEIRLLADDNAPDAESYYFVWRRYSFAGTLAQAEASARSALAGTTLSGCEIYLRDTMVGGFMGFFDNDVDEEYQSAYGDY